MSRVVFIVPFRNVTKYISDCVNSLLNQQNKNWIAIFCDDNSTDGTTSLIPESTHFTIRKNVQRLTALPNIHFAITESHLSDEDIVSILDGDDFLIRNDSVDKILEMYEDDTLLTYGQFIFPNGHIGHCKQLSENEFSNLRKIGFWASHIRTFKYKLYKELLNQDVDLTCFKDSNGEFYTMCADVATMTPLMEIAGFKRVKFNSTPLYFYRLHTNNDHSVDQILQKKIADDIYLKKPFKYVEKIKKIR